MSAHFKEITFQPHYKRTELATATTVCTCFSCSSIDRYEIQTTSSNFFIVVQHSWTIFRSIICTTIKIYQYLRFWRWPSCFQHWHDPNWNGWGALNSTTSETLLSEFRLIYYRTIDTNTFGFNGWLQLREIKGKSELFAGNIIRNMETTVWISFRKKRANLINEQWKCCACLCNIIWHDHTRRHDVTAHDDVLNWITWIRGSAVVVVRHWSHFCSWSQTLTCETCGDSVTLKM